jgi:signal transduction histidine kinase
VTTDLMPRLAALECLHGIPRPELEWLVEHGRFERYEAGEVLAPKGQRIEKLWILLSGYVAVRMDMGAGPRRVIEWRPGDVTGMLPYSRMKGPPGDNYTETPTEALVVHERDFPEMIRSCPAFTAYTVHLMLDRARAFNASALQDEKMVSLGKLAAGLAHELNNPASTTVRGAHLLLDLLTDADQAARALGAAGLTAEQMRAVVEVREGCVESDVALSPLDRAEREDTLADWLERHGADPGHAVALTDAGVTTETMDALAGVVPPTALDVAVRWTAAGCAVRAIAGDIVVGGERIRELVGAMKRFTYMDRRGAAELIDLEPALRDTIRVIAAKARGKGATVSLQVEDGLPRVRGIGDELNQVWLNLLDNALDAIDPGGRVEVSAGVSMDRVVVRVTDDGPGIPDDILPHIFDPLFTTKPPGHGTGLGLDIARRLVRRSDGEIEVDSEPGRTEFAVRLVAEAPDLA